MVIPIIPNNIDSTFTMVNTLSPSVFTQLKNGCQYKKILQDSIIDKTKSMEASLLFPPSPAALYGSIIHLMYEKRMKGLIPDNDSFERAWETEVQRINKDLSRKYPAYSLNNDYDKMFLAEEVAMKMIPTTVNSDNNAPQSGFSSQFERPYKIPGLLYGKIDRITYRNGKTEIIDYKTGKIFDDLGNIKQIYIDQLNIYALMYEFVEGSSVDKLTIIDKEGVEIDIPIMPNKDILKSDVQGILDNINYHITHGTTINLATTSEENCKYCDCRHLCKSYWSSPYLQDSFVKGQITNSGRKFVDLSLDDGTIIHIYGIEKLDIPSSEFYVGRYLMFLEVIPSQQTIGYYIVTKNTLVFDYPSSSDPNTIYYINYLPELHPFVKIALEKGMNISTEGGFYITDDDDMIIAEAGLGIESKKIVVDVDFESQRVFEEKGYKVFCINDIDDFINFLNN